MIGFESSPKLIKLVLFLILIAVLWFSNLFSPTLVVVVSTDAASNSQLFRDEGGGFSEQHSDIKALPIGAAELTYAMQSAKSPLRWDPAQTHVNLSVSEVYIEIAGVKVPGGVVGLRSVHQISNLSRAGDVYQISTWPDADDPQLLIEFREGRVLAQQVLTVLLFVAVIAILVFNRRKIASVVPRLLQDLSIDRIVFQDGSAICLPSKGEFFILLLMAVTLNSYFIANLTLSIDDELAAVRTDPEVWVAQGRWAVYLIEKFLLTQSAIPFLPYLILDICIAFAYMILVRAHGGVPGWKSYLAFPVFCSFPTWWLISEFSSNVTGVALGTLLTVIAACASLSLLQSGISRKIVSFRAALICLMLAIAMACYQSLLFLYLDVVLGVLLLKIVLNVSPGGIRVFRTGVVYIALAAVAMLVYFAINKIFLAVTGAQSSYLGNFVNFAQLINAPLSSIYSVVTEAGNIYLGAESRFGAVIGVAPLILLVSSLYVVIEPRRNKKFIAVVVWVLILATPFLLHVIAGANGVPLRSMISLAYVAWLMTYIVLNSASATSVVLITPVVIVYIVQLLSLNSQYVASASLTQRHDEILAAEIYRRISALDTNFDGDKPVMVDFFGHKRFTTLYAAAWSSTTQASFFDWDNGNVARMLAYMRIQGYSNLAVVDQPTRKSLTPVFVTMPVWPAIGSVQKVNNVYLIRLSKDPDPAHE